MNRREWLRLILAGAAAHTLDIDRLLWIPGQKTFFLPSIHRISVSQIISLELERLGPRLKDLFERDDTFYRIMKSTEINISSSPMKIPLIIRPGEIKNNG